jgi:metallo-beta-lactamase class B
MYARAVAITFLLVASRALAASGPANVPLEALPAHNGQQAEIDARAAVRDTVRSRIPEVKGCYDHELALHPDLAGRVVIQFTIASNGEVVGSSLKRSTMQNAAVENCTERAVRRWTFPEPPAGENEMVVTYPFEFSVESPIQVVEGQADGAGRVEIEPIDAHLFIHRTMDAHGTPANGLVAITERGLLLVDTAWTEEQTDAILAWGDSRFNRPWVGAVITHDHADRAGGVGLLVRRHIPVAALDLTVKHLAARGIRSVRTELAAPATWVEDPRGFEVFYPGRGHAPDNVVIAFPWSGVLFAGCLVKAADATELGFTGDADFTSWPKALRRVGARYPTMQIVPGHGPLEPRPTIAHTLDLLAARRK